MKKTILTTILVGVLVLALAMASSVWPEHRAQIAANSAVVTSLYGDVQVRHGAGGWSKASINSALRSGDAIKTGADARAELTVHGKGYVRLEENTHLLIRYIDDQQGSVLKALIGGVWVSIERALIGASGLKVEMPSAVASVKGTVFRCFVDEQGLCETAVYDGAVECEADNSRYTVYPAQYFAKRRAIAAAVYDLDLDKDAARNWVTWNWRRDLLNILGRPKIMIAMSEHNGNGRLDQSVAQARLVEKLRRAGFNVEALPAAQVPDRPLEVALIPRIKGAAPGAGPGAIPAPPAPPRPGDQAPAGSRFATADIVLAAQFSASTSSPVGATDDGRKAMYSSRAEGKACLFDPRTGNRLAEWSGRRPGRDCNGPGAGHAALKDLGDRFGDDIIPSLIDALVEQKQMIRVRLTGLQSRRELYGVMMRMRSDPRVRRVFPQKLHRGNALLAVVTDLAPKQLAASMVSVGKGHLKITGLQGPVISAHFLAPTSPQAQPPKVNQPGMQGARPQQQFKRAAERNPNAARQIQRRKQPCK